MGLYVYVPILTPYAVKLGGTAAEAGLVVAAYGIPQLTLRILLGMWADRLGRLRPFMIAGFVLVIGSSLGMAFALNPALVAAFRLVSGIAASMWAMFTIAYASLHPGSSHTGAMGWVSFANSLGQVAAALLGSVLVSWLGIRAPFQASVVLAFLGMLLMMTLEVPASDPPRSPNTVRSWFHLVRYPSILQSSVLGALLQAVSFITTYGYVPLLAVHVGVSRPLLGLLLALGLIPTILMSVVTGSLLSQRFSSTLLMVVGFAVTSVCVILTPMTAHALVMLFTLQAILGGARGMISPLLMAWSIRDVAVSQRTTAMATYQSLYAVGMIFGPMLAAGAVGIWGLQAAFVLATLFALLGVGLAITVGLHLKQVRLINHLFKRLKGSKMSQRREDV